MAKIATPTPLLSNLSFLAIKLNPGRVGLELAWVQVSCEQKRWGFTVSEIRLREGLKSSNRESMVSSISTVEPNSLMVSIFDVRFFANSQFDESGENEFYYFFEDVGDSCKRDLGSS